MHNKTVPNSFPHSGSSGRMISPLTLIKTMTNISLDLYFIDILESDFFFKSSTEFKIHIFILKYQYIKKFDINV